MTKNALVTGATSFVGMALVKKLVENGYYVDALVRNGEIDRKELFPENVNVIGCDLSQYKYLPNLVGAEKYDVCVHLAWAGSVGGKRSSYSIQLMNSIYSCDLVEACHQLNCSKIIFAGSMGFIEVYEKMKADLSINKNDIYSISKEYAKNIMQALAAEYGIDFINLRISNIYGPGETNQRLINSSIRKLLLGEHCAFSEGNQWYDFIYITDAVSMIFALCDKCVSANEYYIGSGKIRRLREFLTEMIDEINKDADVAFGEIAYHGAIFSYEGLDLRAVTRETGVEAKTSFREGIEMTKNWIMKSNSMLCEKRVLVPHMKQINRNTN